MLKTLILRSSVQSQYALTMHQKRPVLRIVESKQTKNVQIAENESKQTRR